MEDSSGRTAQAFEPIVSIILPRRSISFWSRLVVLATRIGRPNISAKESQKARAYFLGMVWMAALRYSPRSSGAPTSTSQSE